MEIAAILELVTQLVPVATTLIGSLSSAKSSAGSDGTLALISTLAPVASELVNRIETIRTQTEAEYPAVWAGVRTDWMDTLAKWNALSRSAI